MSWKMSSRIVVAVAALLLVGGCKKSSTSGSDLVVADFVAGLSGTDGSSASRSSGSPPAPSGGPAAEASATGTSETAIAINGGSGIVRLRAASPFQTVYLQVSASPVADYYKLNLNAPTTDANVVVNFGSEIPENSFQTIFSLSALDGPVGATDSIVNTVNTSAATGRWVGMAPEGMIVEVINGQCPSEFDLELNLTSSSTGVTGTATTRLRRTTPGLQCSDVLGRVSTYGLFNGRVESDTISFDLGSTGAYRFSGTFTPTRMTGTFVITEFPQSGRFAVDRQ